MTPEEKGFLYPIRRGDWLSKIAKRYGVPGGWKTIWKHKKNEKFRREHDNNPHLIFPGDRIWIPGASPKRVATSSGKRTRVVKKLKPKIQRIKLGEDDSSKCEIANPQNTVGAIYIPNKYGGDLYLTYPTGRKVRLFYKDGTFPAKSDEASLIEEFKAGSHEIIFFFTLGGKESSTLWQIKPNKKGWFFFTISGKTAVSIKNEFTREHSLTKEPWNSWWWPSDDGKDPNMFDIKVTYSTPPGEEPGPLKKYDKYAGTEAAALSAWKWEWDNIRYPAGTGDTAGMCDATSWAGFETTRPSGDKSTFREQDRLGLCAERYWVGTNGEVNVDEPGTSYHLFRKQGSYLKADWFHNKLRERIAEDKGGIIVYVPNWNAGVYKYKLKFVAHGTNDADIKKVKITNEMTHKSWAKWDGTDASFSTTYDLEYADDGTVHRALSWDPAGKPTKVYYKKPTAPILNPKLDKSKLENIFR